MKKEKPSAHAPKELFDELKALVAEAQTMMAGSLSEHSAEALDNLRERFGDVQDRLAVFYDDTREKVVAGARCTDVAIRENPYQSVLIAAGAGLFMGLLLGRRGR